MSRRVLVTGADTFWGGRMIQALEADPSMDVILGMGARAPSVPFERAEFVRADQTYSILNRIVKATQVDTILHTFMITDSTTVPRRAMHEINVIGTMNLLAAAGAAGSSVRHVVVKSSTLVYGSAASDPNTFHEDMPRTSPVKNSVERSLVEAEGLVRDFSEDNPATRVDRPPVRQRPRHTPDHADQPKPLAAPVPSHLRLRPAAPVPGGGRRHASSPPCHPGQHPRPLQRGGRRASPVERGGQHLRDPAGPALAVQPLEAPPCGSTVRPARELEDLLRYGRGVDTRRFAATGFTYNATSAGAVRTFIRALRLRRQSGRTPMSYTYEHDVEQFFRHSPSVMGANDS